MQRQAAEAGGWRMGKNSRWKTYHTRRGCGERVRDIGDVTLQATAGAAVGGGRNSMIQKTAETGGAVRLKWLTISDSV